MKQWRLQTPSEVATIEIVLLPMVFVFLHPWKTQV
jgi:hypothetical protein